MADVSTHDDTDTRPFYFNEYHLHSWNAGAFVTCHGTCDPVNGLTGVTDSLLGATISKDNVLTIDRHPGAAFSPSS